MSKKSFIDSVEVKNPCTEDWEQMHGNDRVRFCSHCSKHVNNLSEMTRKEAMRLVRASDGNLCIRYIPNPITQRPMFAEQLLQITRRTPRLTAGVISASLSLSTFAYAQEETPSPTPTDDTPAVVETQDDATEAETNDEQAEETNEPEETPAQPEEALGQAEETNDQAEQPAETAKNEVSIEGTIWDPNGKPVPGVTLHLYNTESVEYENNATTDRNGHYIFKELKVGTYLIRIYSSNGALKKAMPEITLNEGQKSVQNLHVTVIDSKELNVRGWGMGGAMAMISYSLPLSQAVNSDDIAAALNLISKGADVNGKDANYDDITPLFLAAEKGNLQMVKLLLDHGANANAKDKTKRTPLMFVDEDATPQLIEMLVGAGADIKATDEKGGTILLHTIEGIKHDVLGSLISAGADINKADDEGNTPLIKVAQEDKFDLVEALIVAGSDVNARNKSGESAWDKTSNMEIEKFLEQYGATTDYGNITVIKYSASNGNDPPTD